MKLNNKGFSFVEVFAIIIIASTIIFPMITTLVNNIEINEKLHNRRSAVAISQGTAEGFNRMSFTKIEELVTASNSANKYYVEIDESSCAQLDSSEDIALCGKLFTAIFSNLSLTDETFKVFITDYNLDTSRYNELTRNGNGLPTRVIDEITKKTVTTDPNPDLYSIYVWIRFDDDPYTGDMVFGGVLSNE